MRPIADGLGYSGSAAYDRAAVVAVGVIMLAKWTMAWLSYLPDRSGPAAVAASRR